jgi:hypothetical protein
MRASRMWAVMGLGLGAACTGTPASSPASSPPAAAGPAAGLDWKRDGQQLRLATKGETTYLVVVTDTVPSPATSAGAGPAPAAARPATVVSQEFGRVTVDVGAGRAVVYAITPVLSCVSGAVQCAECSPGGRTEADCGLPPLPPAPHFARALTMLSHSRVGQGGGGR